MGKICIENKNILQAETASQHANNSEQGSSLCLNKLISSHIKKDIKLTKSKQKLLYICTSIEFNL